MCDDRFRIRSGRALLLAATCASTGAASAALSGAPTQGSSAVAALARLDHAQRRSAWIEIEPTSPAMTAGDFALASEAAAMWNAGAHDNALATLQAMGDPTTVGIGVWWLAPRGGDEGGIAGFSDVTIDANDAVGSIALEVNHGNGALYCAVQVADGWRLHRGDAFGGSWNNVYTWFGAAGVVDMDMSISSGWVYIGYVVSGTTNELRVRRVNGATGDLDVAYNFQVAFDAAPATIEEVAATSNADDASSNIYFAALQSNDTVGYHWAPANNGTLWTEIDVGVNNAERGLDATYNHAGGAQYFLFLSYIASDDSVRVAQRESGVGWTVFNVEATYTGTIARTCISAWDDTIIVVYRELFDVQGLRYRISYTAGQGTWGFSNIYLPAAGEPPAVNFDVTAQGGYGTAIVYCVQSGEPDEVYLRKRLGYANTLWQAPVQINDGDVLVSSTIEMELNWATPLDGNNHSYRFGTVYPRPDPIFDLRRNCTGDANDSGTVDIDDLLAVVGGWGACPDCDSCNGDIQPFGGNCLVDINDLLTVVGLWGPCP